MKNNEQEILLASVMLKVSVLEKLLIKSGIITDEQIISEMNKLSNDVINFIKNKS